MLKPVLASLTVDPSEGSRLGDVLITVRFPASAFTDSTPADGAAACANRVRAMALQWFRDNGRRPDESGEQFVERIRRGAVKDASLTMHADDFASVQEVS